MSDEIMLQGVLRMPIDCWSNDIISVTQRHGRYIQAADKIESLEKRLKELDERELALINRISEFLSNSGFRMADIMARAVNERFIETGGRHQLTKTDNREG